MINFIKFLLVLIAFLLAVAFIDDARAEAWSTPNQAGGKIVITDRKCQYFTHLSEAYTYTAEGEVIKSCWTVVDGAIHVVYYNGQTRVYSISLFSKELSL